MSGRNKRGMAMKMERTTGGLRGVLLDEIDTLRDGSTTEGRAHAIARLANATIATVRLEMDAQEFMARNVEQVKGATIAAVSHMKPLSLVA